MRKGSLPARPTVDLDDPILSPKDQEFLSWMLLQRDGWEVEAGIQFSNAKFNTLDTQIITMDASIRAFWQIIRGFHDTVPTQPGDLV